MFSRCLCALIALSVLLDARAASQGEPDGRFAVATAHGRDLVKRLMAADGIPGMSVAVGLGGRIVWSEGFGFADVAHQRPVERETQFRLGSVSKLLTVAVVAHLSEKGVLDIDAPVQRYIPTFPQADGMTTRRLTGHLGGIRHYLDRDHEPGRDIDEQHFDHAEDALGIFAHDPLVARPGERFSYSTFGFTLVTAVVERVSGRAFLDDLRDEVLTPLEMIRTAADDPRVAMAMRARFYDRTDRGEVAPAAFVDPSYKWGGGGLLSTSEDLVRFGTAHLVPGTFTADTLRMMFTSQRTVEGTETGVGMAWWIQRRADGRTYAYHTGNMQGCRALLWLDRDSGVVIAMLSNLGGRPQGLEELAPDVARAFREAGQGDL